MAGRTDMIHSMSYIGDVAATLFVLGTNDRALGRAWHVPTLPAVTLSDRINQLADAAKVDRVKVNRVPTVLLRAAGLFIPPIREVVEMLYQFEAPFEIDATDTTDTFGLEPTPLEEQLLATIESYRAENPMA
jgi:nucleoside-diphosphate-sugar epimerase